MIRIILRPVGWSTFRATLETTGEHLVTSDQPLADGARALLRMGYDPLTHITMRYAGSAHDSFAPKPIGEWAKITYSESADRALHKKIWKPYPDVVSRAPGEAKVDLGAPEGKNTHPEKESL